MVSSFVTILYIFVPLLSDSLTDGMKEEGKAFPSFTGFRLRREVNRSHFAHSRPLYEGHGFEMVRISSKIAR